MEIIVPFAEIIAVENLTEFSNDNFSFYNKSIQIKKSVKPSMKWHSDTYNTINTSYDVKNDKLFQPLVKTIQNKTTEFANEFGVSNKKIVCESSWLNISEPNNFQEYHNHGMSHFSAVYYVKTPKNSGNLIFKSHSAWNNMFPFKVNDMKLPAHETFYIEPSECLLVIFKSNLFHMVESNKSNENRISIALNFVIND